MPSRLRAMDPFRLDLLIGALLLVEFELEVLLVVPSDPQKPLVAGLMALVAAGVALRRRAPVAGIVLVNAGLVPVQALGRPFIDHVALPAFMAFVAAYSVGAHAESRRLVAGTAVGCIGGTLLTIADAESTGTSYIFNVAITVIAPVLIGRLMRIRSRLNRALREKTEALERRRGAAAVQAVSDERTRIAGELHDVVAHALSAMTVQAAGARRLVTSDPARARQAFATVEAAGRDGLDELRRLLGVLRREDEQLALAPQPSLRHAGSLARRMTAAGLPVEIEGATDGLPAGIDLTAYRVVQEALSAALEHGHAGRATVRIARVGDAVELQVLDDGPGAPARPLMGVSERVTLYGGQLHAGPRRSGGHAVRARLPLAGGVG
jgi:signal transduction histidine kinase